MILRTLSALRIQIFDITGKMQQQLAVANFSPKVNVDVQNLTSGIYFARITDSKENSRLVKFSKN